MVGDREGRERREGRVLIREARLEDVETIHEILTTAFWGLRDRGYSHRALEAAIVPPEEIARRIGQGGCVLVAEADRLIVGTVTGLEEHEALHVCSLAVRPDWQGQEIARQLMEALENVARQRGCHKLWLQTAWAMTEAIALYERLGYRREGYQPRQFYGEDFVMFGKVLEGKEGMEGTEIQGLTGGERAVVEQETPWARAYEVVRAAAGRKLVRFVTPENTDWYGTLVSDPEPRLIFHEPVRFVVTVHAAQGVCRAGHKVGDRWEFDWCTPAGLCGSAYHTMYPVLHGLGLTNGRYEGPAAQETLVSCPDEGWLTFRIERQRWTPEMWDESGQLENEPKG